MLYTYIYPSFVGDLCIVADDSHLLSISFANDYMSDDGEPVPDSPLMIEAVSQLNGYFAGRLKTFDLPLEFSASKFDVDVWKDLQRIPYGEVRTYGEIADDIKRKGAARAVGTACRMNPFAVVVPCHRVVSVSKGAMSGYAGGMDRKIALLEFERSNRY